MELALSHRRGKDGRDSNPSRSSGNKSGGKKSDEPGWAAGLRQLYNSVLDEPLPDSFDDLLKKLDRNDHGRD